MAIGVLNPRDDLRAISSRPSSTLAGAGTRRWFRDGTVLYGQDVNAIIAQIRSAVDFYGVTDVEGDDTALRQAIGNALTVGSISGLAAGVGAWLADPTSAKLRAAVPDETGSGALVFGISPTLTTPNIGAAAGISLALSSTINSALVVGGTPPIVGIATGAVAITGATGTLNLSRYVATTAGPSISLAKSRGTLLVAAPVQADDILGSINFVSDEGITNGTIGITSGIYRARVDGAPAGNIIIAKHEWMAKNPAGSTTVLMTLWGSGGLSLVNNPTLDPGAGNFESEFDVISGGALVTRGDNLQEMRIKQATTLLTIAAGATSTATNLIPAQTKVIGVSARVTVVIPTAATFDVGVSGATTRYGSGISTTVNTTNKGLNDDGARYYASATSIVITPNATPASNTGRVRLTVHYIDIVPASS